MFIVEIDTCARCGGKLKVNASIEVSEVIARILAHLEETVAEQKQAELPPRRRGTADSGARDLTPREEIAHHLRRRWILPLQRRG